MANKHSLACLMCGEKMDLDSLPNEERSAVMSWAKRTDHKWAKEAAERTKAMLPAATPPADAPTDLAAMVNASAATEPAPDLAALVNGGA